MAAPQRALDRGYRGSRPPQPRDQSLHSTNKRRYFQYAVRSTVRAERSEDRHRMTPIGVLPTRRAGQPPTANPGSQLLIERTERGRQQQGRSSWRDGLMIAFELFRCRFGKTTCPSKAPSTAGRPKCVIFVQSNLSVWPWTGRNWNLDGTHPNLPPGPIWVPFGQQGWWPGTLSCQDKIGCSMFIHHRIYCCAYWCTIHVGSRSVSVIVLEQRPERQGTG